MDRRPESILDTDLGPDADDASAVATLYAYMVRTAADKASARTIEDLMIAPRRMDSAASLRVK